MENTANDDWNGEWWAESLTGTERVEYEALVTKLISSGPAQIPLVAREIFQMAFKLGDEMCYENMRD